MAGPGRDLFYPPSGSIILAMFLFRMAGPGRDLFYPPSGSIILYVCKRVIKDPATETRVKKDPGLWNKIPDPKVQICDFHNTFGTGKWTFAFCLGMFSDSSDSVFLSHCISCEGGSKWHCMGMCAWTNNSLRQLLMVTWQCVFAKCSLRSLLHLRFRVLSLPKGLALCSAHHRSESSCKKHRHKTCNI